MHDRVSSPTRVEAVMADIRGRIAARRLVPGARLPSVRDLADTMKVSKSTVVDAYERLVAEGAIASRRGSGFYVAGTTRPLSLQSLRPDLDRAIDPLWMTRQNLGCGPEVLKPGWGLLPDSYMPDEAVQKALRDIARDPDPAGRLRYTSPLGLAPLREQIALHLAARGVAAEPDAVLLTDSVSHGLDLLLRFFIEPGETVLVDDPCYFNFLALLLSHRARVVSVPFGPEGVDTEALERVLAAERPRLYLTTAGPQNPTGAVLSAATAHRVLSLAERHGTIIIEDDCFADFESEPSPRLAAADGFARVVLVGGFSKTVSSAMRSGFIAARPDWIDGLVDLKLSTCHSGNHLSAQITHRVLSSGAYKRHVEALRGKLARDRALAMSRLRACGLACPLEPKAGMYLWASLPAGLDAAAVARVALEQNVLLAPGDVFSASRSATGHLRFNAAACGDPRIFDVLARAIDRAVNLCAGIGPAGSSSGGDVRQRKPASASPKVSPPPARAL